MFVTPALDAGRTRCGWGLVLNDSFYFSFFPTCGECAPATGGDDAPFKLMTEAHDWEKAGKQIQLLIVLLVNCEHLDIDTCFASIGLYFIYNK